MHSLHFTLHTLKAALDVFLRSIPTEKVKFNIYSFGSSHSQLWDHSRPYGQKTLEEAAAHVSRFRADMGGTEIFGVLEKAVLDRVRTDALLKPYY
jgi:hypothetical protein